MKPKNTSYKELREEISKILIKWSMGTRQAAITDLVNLFESQLIREREHIKRQLRGKIGTSVLIDGNESYQKGFVHACQWILDNLG